ncbi:MAG: glycosyltransferase [Cryobacterium sp.]|nr:glycosyltransferase [Oligoflexia bacterium]
MNPLPHVTVLLATYEMPKHLEMVLTALDRQSFKNFEILLCDDGSGEETARVVRNFAPHFTQDFVHLWQENQGFRKCRLLNEGIRRSRGELIVFLDADCVPHRDFISDHWVTRRNGTYGAGRRVELSEAVSHGLTLADVRSGIFDRPSLRILRDQVFGKTTNFNRTLRWGTFKPLRKILNLEQIDDLKGCNFSAFREDLFAINGFNEAYEGYGREDTDVEIRMRNLGLSIRSLKGLALQFHVWHERRGFTPANETLLEEARHTKRIRADRGIEGGDRSGISVRN